MIQDESLYKKARNKKMFENIFDTNKIIGSKQEKTKKEEKYDFSICYVKNTFFYNKDSRYKYYYKIIHTSNKKEASKIFKKLIEKELDDEKKKHFGKYYNKVGFLGIINKKDLSEDEINEINELYITWREKYFLSKIVSIEKI